METPSTALGYKVGDRFTVVNDYDGVFTQGSIIELYRDDGTINPPFLLIEGWCRYENCDGLPGAYLRLSKVAPCDARMADTEITQTKSELIEENKSLSKQIKSLLSRRDWLARELASLDDRITRKKQFVQDNKKSIKGVKA